MLVFNALGRGSGTFKSLWASSVNIGIIYGLSQIVGMVVVLLRGVDSFATQGEVQRAIPSLALLARTGGERNKAGGISGHDYTVFHLVDRPHGDGDDDRRARSKSPSMARRDPLLGPARTSRRGLCQVSRKIDALEDSRTAGNRGGSALDRPVAGRRADVIAHASTRDDGGSGAVVADAGVLDRPAPSLQQRR